MRRCARIIAALAALTPAAALAHGGHGASLLAAAHLHADDIGALIALLLASISAAVALAAAASQPEAMEH